tara:strand:+ start:865 stop:1635 length:771 start_codon:yes stop_codon:yes gene_type:complete
LERHGFANLILLCANHHKVIDDDEIAYTVNRLLEMKSAHEDHATPMENSVSNLGGQALVDFVIHSSNQTGGITANNIGVVNISHAATNTALNERTIQAQDILWSAIQKLRQHFQAAIFADGTFSLEELQSYFSGDFHNPMLNILTPYSSNGSFYKILEEAFDSNVGNQRPFVSSRLYEIFFVIQLVIARSATLLNLSFAKHAHKDWREDIPIKENVLGLLGENATERLFSLHFGGLNETIKSLEHLFLKEMEAKRN